MVSVSFYLLDVVARHQEGRTVILLFGRVVGGEKIIAVDTSFKPYFYAVLKKGQNIEDAKERIMAVQLPSGEGAVHAIEIWVEKKVYGPEECFALKVFAETGYASKQLAAEVAGLPGVEACLEADIGSQQKYLLQKAIAPLTMVSVEGEIISYRARCAVISATEVKSLGSEDYQFQIMAFDIESFHPYGKTLIPKNEPITMIGVHSEKTKKVLTLKNITGENIEVLDSELALLERFREIVIKDDPDILAGYYSDSFDFAYLIARAERYKIQLDFGSDYTQLTATETGTFAGGLLCIDFERFVRKIRSEASLEAVSNDLLDVKSEPVDVSLAATKTAAGLLAMAAGIKNDAELIYKLSQLFTPALLETAHIFEIGAPELIYYPLAELVEWLLVKSSFAEGRLVTPKPSRETVMERAGQRSAGAYSIGPKVGLFDDVACFDLRLLYPSIIIRENITPEESGMKQGMVPTVLGQLLERRQRVKSILKDSPGSRLSIRQDALRLTASAFYLYYNYSHARWYNPDCVRQITSSAKEIVIDIATIMESKGLEVLYSDSQFMFAQLQKGAKVEDAIAAVQQKLAANIEFELLELYKRAIFVAVREGEAGAKNRYALLTSRGTVKITGFEAVKKNYSSIAREVQRFVLTMVLSERNPLDAVSYVQKVVGELRGKMIPVEKLVIYTQLQKEIDAYDIMPAHVVLAKKLRERGAEVSSGFIVRYVVGVGPGKLRDKARLVEDIGEGGYDAEYYIEHQVLPSVLPILKIFGYTEEDILSSSQKKLDSFLRPG